MSHRTTHSFEIIYDAYLLLIAQLFDTMYHISTISDILREGVDSLAQWLEHWISTPAVQVRIPSGTWDFFKLCIISLLRIFIFVRYHLQ